MKVLVLTDSPLLQTGFARVAANVLDRWLAAGVEVVVWGNGQTAEQILEAAYRKALPCPIKPAGYPWYTQENLQRFLYEIVNGDYTHVWVMQDAVLLAQGNFPEVFRAACTQKGVRSVYYCPVDATLDPSWAGALRAFDAVVPYCNYGLTQIKAVLGDTPHPGLMEPIPHGVDTSVYHPISIEERKRARAEYAPWAGTGPLFLNVNAHQQRKDLPSSLMVLKEMRMVGLPDARLLLHCRNFSKHHMTDLDMVGRQLGLVRGVHWECSDQHFTPGGRPTLPEAELARLYGAADMLITTTLGEGWGLTITEAMACGLPVAAPSHTAIHDVFNMVAGKGVPFLELPQLGSPVVLAADNSRLRCRVDALRAACRIREFRVHWDCAAERCPLPSELAARWGWNLIATRMLDVLKGGAR